MAKNLNDDNENKKAKYCPNCGSELNNEADKCPNCGYFPGMPKNEKCKNHKIKNFILKFGRLIIDIDTCFWFAVIILVMIAFWIVFFGSFLPNNDGYFDSVPYAPLWIILSIVLPFIMLLVLTSFKFFVYLLIDIRDSLKNIEESNVMKDRK